MLPQLGEVVQCNNMGSCVIPYGMSEEKCDAACYLHCLRLAKEWSPLQQRCDNRSFPLSLLPNYSVQTDDLIATLLKSLCFRCPCHAVLASLHSLESMHALRS